MNVVAMLMKRRSIRTYTGEPIPQKKLDQVIQSGLLSETSRNRKPWEFIVVQNPEVLEKLSQCRAMGSGMLKNAAAAIVVVGDEEKADTWIEDCSIAMANMHLTADAIGLGSCWIQGRMRFAGDERSTESYVQEVLEIPGNFRLEAILSLGMIEKHPEGHELPDVKCEKVHYEKF